jgi:hypothetical protein
MSFTVAVRPVRAVGGFAGGYGAVEHVVTQDFFGRVSRLPLGNHAGTTLSRAGVVHELGEAFSAHSTGRGEELTRELGRVERFLHSRPVDHVSRRQALL